jgi:hypothetical protein
VLASSSTGVVASTASAGWTWPQLASPSVIRALAVRHAATRASVGAGGIEPRSNWQIRKGRGEASKHLPVYLGSLKLLDKAPCQMQDTLRLAVGYLIQGGTLA